MRTSVSIPGSMCQSVIIGSLTLRNTKHAILGGNFIFQNFEWSLSCSTFSRQLKPSEKQDQNIRFTIAGKYLKKQREIAMSTLSGKVEIWGVPMVQTKTSLLESKLVFPIKTD